MNLSSKPALYSCVFAILVAIPIFTGCNSPGDMPGGKLVDISDFGDELSADEMVLVKFGATWCGPCREIEKELDTIDTGKLGVKVVKVDVDDQPGLSRKFNVNGIPHLMLVRNGKTLQERKGYQSAEELTQWIKRNQ